MKESHYNNTMVAIIFMAVLVTGSVLMASTAVVETCKMMKIESGLSAATCVHTIVDRTIDREFGDVE